jgi:hypothetical protein
VIGFSPTIRPPISVAEMGADDAVGRGQLARPFKLLDRLLKRPEAIEGPAKTINDVWSLRITRERTTNESNALFRIEPSIHPEKAQKIEQFRLIRSKLDRPEKILFSVAP